VADRPRILIVLGTRPEAIKFFPIVRELQADPGLDVRLATTGQHREMVDQILGPFGVVPDHDLNIMKPDQSINDIVCRVIPPLERLYLERSPKMIVVQGDTTSASSAGLAAFHRRIPVAHVEAGLRSFDRFQPYPEESNRRMLSCVADLHLAATPMSAENLRREGVAPADIVVTGNTVIDALLGTLSRSDLLEQHRVRGLRIDPADPMVLITLHRRENWMKAAGAGESPLEEVLRAISTAAGEFPKAQFVYPVHRNPRVQEPARWILGSRENVHLLDPQPYIPFVDLMGRASVILTDSGGVQEEAPSLGVPALVAREVTERPEAVATGANVLVGTKKEVVLDELRRRLANPSRRSGTRPFPSPYGDGKGAARTVKAILHRLGRGERPGEFKPDGAAASPAQGGTA
jgi:UDP-N-acetylglucosamine 2-epimerase (non-hydrolysing)